MNDAFDFGMAFSDRVHELDRLQKLRARIGKIGTRCGDCDKWMKSCECPKEHNVNGQTTGPSSDEIKCNQFTEALSSTRLRTQLLAELHPHKPTRHR
jgi:hypothetical protein